MTGRQPVRGGLRITSPLAISDREEEQIRDKWTAITDEVLNELEEKGFGVPAKPDFSPELLTHENLIGTSPEDYAKLYTEHLRWYNYAAPFMAQIKARLSGIRTALKDEETAIRDKMRETNKAAGRGKMTEQEIKDKVWLDPRYQDLLLQEEKYSQMKEVMSAQMDIMDRNMKLISRIEEERKVEFSGERRAGNMGRSPQQSRFRGR